ncbi:MAG: hypothetical protein Q9N62_11295 [Ghiorsea sp.]|nr:hypothetical protein [Ghiorsea sp.]MDQ7058958.1 hypothetical protein [Ghiorsea sp.]
MQRDFDHFVKHKKQRNRFIAIFILTLLAAAIVVLVQECSQSFNEPYNKDYQPMDKARHLDAGKQP